MALTVAEVSHPNSQSTHVSLSPFKAKVVDITWDSSYLTGGEVLTAASLGWVQLYGAIALTNPCTSTGTLAALPLVKPNTAKTQLTFQLAEGGTTANDNPLKEVTSTQDMSTYTGRFLLLGA